jgi:uncharacterized protein YjbK
MNIKFESFLVKYSMQANNQENKICRYLYHDVQHGFTEYSIIVRHVYNK